MEMIKLEVCRVGHKRVELVKENELYVIYYFESDECLSSEATTDIMEAVITFNQLIKEINS